MNHSTVIMKGYFKTKKARGKISLLVPVPVLRVHKVKKQGISEEEIL